MLSTEEIRRWCRAKTRRGARKHLREFDREFATGAFLRTVGVEQAHFVAFVLDKRPLTLEKRRRIARFIEDWEAGMLEFTKSGYHTRAELVRRKTPRPMGVRATVQFGHAGPKLTFLARPERERMPAFPDVMSAFDRKGK